MPYVKYIASNVKGGISCILGEKTIVIGPNGSGKSAVINSVELALGGYATDLFGRESMSKESDLIQQLAPGRKGELFARAVFDDGSEAKWHAGTKDSKKAIHRFPDPLFDPLTVFPLSAVLAAVKGKPETARKFFIEFATPNLTNEDITGRIDKELHDNYRNSILSATQKDSPLDRLLMALEHAAKKSRETKSKANAQVELATTVAGGLMPLPTSEMEAAVRKTAKDARNALDKLIQTSGAVESLRKLQAEAEPLKAQLQQAQTNVGLCQAALSQADQILAATPSPAFLDEHTLRVIAIVEKLAALEATSGGQPIGCPVCKTVAAHGTFTQRNQAAQAFKLGEEAKNGPHQQAVAARGDVIGKLAGWQQHVNTLQAQLDAINNAMAAGNVQAPSEMQFAEAKQKVEQAEGEVARLDALKASWATASQTKNVANDANTESGKWKLLHDACNKVVSDLLDHGILTFIAKVRAFLPPTDVFDLKLRDGTKQVFQLGLVKEGNIYTAMSGAEWARVTAALAAACRDPKKPLSIIIPEERAFDAQTLLATCTALTNVPGQVIIASPVAPAAAPAGWTIVNTAANQHRTGQL
jgi:hypothetical protein